MRYSPQRHIKIGLRCYVQGAEYGVLSAEFKFSPKSEVLGQ